MTDDGGRQKMPQICANKDIGCLGVQQLLYNFKRQICVNKSSATIKSLKN